MISYIIESLPKEADKIILAVNYRKDQIEKYFDETNFGKEIIVNDEKTPLGTGGASKFAEKHITGRFFVLNSDIICSLNLEDMLKFHKKNNAVSTISLWPVENVSEFGVVDVKDDGNIVRFVEKPKPEDAPSNLINAGAYILEPEVLDYIETGRLVSMEKEIFPRIISDTGRFFGFKFKGHWIDIGRISSYIEVHKFLMKKRKMKNYYGENCDIRGVLKDSCLGNNVHVGDNTRLESTIVYSNARIGKNVSLENCIIGENSVVGDFSVLKNSVVGDKEEIKAKSKINDLFVWSKPVPAGYPDKQIGNAIAR